MMREHATTRQRSASRLHERDGHLQDRHIRCGLADGGSVRSRSSHAGGCVPRRAVRHGLRHASARRGGAPPATERAATQADVTPGPALCRLRRHLHRPTTPRPSTPSSNVRQRRSTTCVPRSPTSDARESRARASPGTRRSIGSSTISLPRTSSMVRPRAAEPRPVHAPPRAPARRG